MTLQIKEHKNKMEIYDTPNNLDKALIDDDISPLPNYSGFSMLIVGPSGSGKTTALYSMMSKRKIQGKRVSYRKVFDKIYIISPTMANGSMKQDPFKDIPKNQVYRKLTIEGLEELEERIKKNREDDLHSVIILDDVGSEIKLSAAVLKKLTAMQQNRRHDFTSYFCLLQKFKDAPTGIRNNISHLMLFKPKNEVEKETIASELFPFNKKKFQQLFNYIFENKNRFSMLFVDMSLKNTNKFIFHNGFNPLELYDEETKTTN